MSFYLDGDMETDCLEWSHGELFLLGDEERGRGEEKEGLLLGH